MAHTDGIAFGNLIYLMGTNNKESLAQFCIAMVDLYSQISLHSPGMTASDFKLLNEGENWKQSHGTATTGVID
jgi:hypothetical protein